MTKGTLSNTPLLLLTAPAFAPGQTTASAAALERDEFVLGPANGLGRTGLGSYRSHVGAGYGWDDEEYPALQGVTSAGCPVPVGRYRQQWHESTEYSNDSYERQWRQEQVTRRRLVQILVLLGNFFYKRIRSAKGRRRIATYT
jgi:hypothetical protein